MTETSQIKFRTITKHEYGIQNPAVEWTELIDANFLASWVLKHISNSRVIDMLHVTKLHLNIQNATNYRRMVGVQHHFQFRQVTFISTVQSEIIIGVMTTK